jgi:hypothetical protein
MTRAEARNSLKGDKVIYWSWLRKGDGKEGELSYAGVYDICGTPCVYVRGKGAIALTHVERLDANPDAPDSETTEPKPASSK